MNNITQEFKEVIERTLPKFFKSVEPRKHSLGNGSYLKIIIAANNYEINRVSEQYPQDVSLMFDIDDDELRIQIFGGMGGQCVYVKPQKNLNLYMERVKIPFRRVKTKDKALKALEKFCLNYKQALADNKDNLMYQDVVNYDDLLS